jgi:1-acyl-sn-glycerol-3-phosphate acyltransferase
MTDRRFWPLFWVQFLTAFNDNVFKGGLVLLVTYGADLFGRPVLVFGLDAAMMNTLGGLLLMLPFFLFSATAGQLADRYSKSAMMRWVKFVEIGLMVAAGAGFIWAAAGQPETAGAFLLVVLFFMGTQSAFFGPIKYAILPQLLPRSGELVTGNALVETGTYISVLLGGVAATALFLAPRAMGLTPDAGLYAVGVGVVAIAVVGWGIARQSPDVGAEKPDLGVRFDPFTSTWQVMRGVARRGDVLYAIFANSWFWALGAAVLSLFPTWIRDDLGADETTYTLFMALFSIGIGAGSLLCARLSGGRLEMGMVMVGAVGISLFLADLFFGGAPWTPPSPDAPRLTTLELLQRPASWRLIADTLGLAVSGGFFMVPLYTFLQEHSPPGERARVIGALNVFNALFIVATLGLTLVALGFGLEERTFFVILAGINLYWAISVYFALPFHLLRFTAVLLSKGFWRYRIDGMSNLPPEGPALVVCNHVSFVDFLLLMAAITRRHKFVIWHEYTRKPIIGPVVMSYGVIPVSADGTDRAQLLQSFRDVSATLRQGEVVVIFPEGGLPYSPEIQPFMRGLEVILKRDPVPVVPMALNGLWGGAWSRKGGRALKSFRPPFRPIWLTVGEPLDPQGLTAEKIREVVLELWTRRPANP